MDGGDLHLRLQRREMAAPAGWHGKIERAIQPVVSPRAFARLIRSLRRAPKVPLIFPPQTLRQITQSCSRVYVRRAVACAVLSAELQCEARKSTEDSGLYRILFLRLRRLHFASSFATANLRSEKPIHLRWNGRRGDSSTRWQPSARSANSTARGRSLRRLRAGGEPARRKFPE